MKHNAIVVVCAQGNILAERVANHLVTYAKSKKIKADMLTAHFQHYEAVVFSGDAQYDLAVSVGGDGTALCTARACADRGIPVLPIKVGDFGFITEFTHEYWEEAFDLWMANKMKASSRMLLHAEVFRHSKCIGSYSGLNDVVIAVEKSMTIARLHLKIDENFLTDYRSDGIIIATPTGSTAYSLSSGGPILEPEMNALLLIPIAPFTLSHRPLILSDQRVLSVEISEQQRGDIDVFVDGKSCQRVIEGDVIRVGVHTHKAQIMCSVDYHFFDTLRRKLKWTGTPDA